MKNQILYTALIISLGLAVYSNSVNNDFIWDDELLIIDNESIKDLSNTPGLFSQHIAFGSSIKSNAYRPLQMFSYALNYACFKLDARTYHLTNIITHILSAIMLYLLAQLISGDSALGLISALLFISHPIHSEAVTYISGRADLLACLFILCTVVCYIKFWQNKKNRLFYLLSIISFFLGLLSKEIVVIAPLLLLAYSYIYQHPEKRLLKLTTPFFLISAVYLAFRKTILDFPVEKTVIDVVTVSQRIPVIFKSLTMYFDKLLLPLNLHMEYEPIVPMITDIQVILGFAIAAMLILGIIVYRRRERLVAFSCAWLLINYLPVSNIYPLNALFAEHWSYTPSIGLFLLAGWMAVRISNKARWIKLPVYLILGFLLTCNSCLLFKQNQYWGNPEAFYKRTLQYAPDSFRVHFRLGLYYLRQGRIDQGIEQFQRSLAINPAYSPSYNNLVSAYIMKADYDQVVNICRQAQKIDADSAGLHNNFGIAYSAKTDYREAIAEFKQAISINPNYAEAYNNLGSAYAGLGDSKKAEAAYRKALELSPNYTITHKNLRKLLTK